MKQLLILMLTIINVSRAMALEVHDMEAARVVQSREEIETATKKKWKTVIGFGGYSASGYQDLAAAQKAWKATLEKIPVSDRASTLVITGGTDSGVGAVAELASRMGFRIAGLASEAAKQETLHPKLNYMFYVKDASWGGTVNGTARLQPASHALARAVDHLHVVGGGEVSAMEFILTRLSGKKATFTPADMGHDYARKRNLNPAGAAYDLIVPERTQTAKLVHESWRAPYLLSNGEYTPQIRSIVENGRTRKVDIANLEYERLPQSYKNLNLQTADVAIAAVKASEVNGTIDEAKVVSIVQRKYLETARGLKGAELEAALAKIPPSEREKAAALVRSAIAIKEQHTARNQAIYDLAEKMHSRWREARPIDSKSGLREPRYKIYNGQKYDIANLRFADLPVEEQYRNLIVSKVAIEQLQAGADASSIRAVHEAIYDAYRSVNGISLKVPIESLTEPNKKFIQDTVTMASAVIENTMNIKTISCIPDFARIK